MQLQGTLPSTSCVGGKQLRTHRKFSRCSVLARANRYQVPGKFGHKELPSIPDVRVGGDDELPIFAQIRPTLPAAPGLYDIPLVVMSSGFLLPSTAYTSYANHLASHGYAVVRYDLSEIMDDVGAMSALRTVADVALKDNSIGSIVDPKCLVLFGHSRGAKLSCLAAERDDRVRGMVLLDPVDNTSMTPAGENFPSSLPSLRRATKIRNLPVLVVGAAMNGDLIPAEGNYKKFNSACVGPFWEVDLLGAGHLSFLDKRDEMDPFTQMAAMMGRPPSTPEASVSAVTKVATTAWLQEVVLPYAALSLGRTSAPPPPPSKELERVLYDNIVNIELPDGKAPRRSNIRGLRSQSEQGGSSAGGADESSSGKDTSSSQGGWSNKTQASPSMASSLCGLSREELLRLRARELKENLIAAGVKNDDCFEKEQLVQRVLEACGKFA
ncbi:Alpha/Beta hydrolase protein [Dunaliella salina]|uniref:Alpha/Beta hydrolase protein n=1 Tax=Dunaliella salina TaxID=3046 RepID=A0ABQ7GCW3_DUNSA|nr:Alpha/Beta hydrolase protein [Dunaliella salina]|eukprot:KAF5832425.1 Alpha/Beta hydrolase protein [Dunaliella salina]